MLWFIFFVPFEHWLNITDATQLNTLKNKNRCKITLYANVNVKVTMKKLFIQENIFYQAFDIDFKNKRERGKRNYWNIQTHTSKINWQHLANKDQHTTIVHTKNVKKQILLRAKSYLCGVKIFVRCRQCSNIYMF